MKTDKTSFEQKFETKTTDEDHDKMHGNIKNLDKFIAWSRLLNDNKLDLS